MSVGQDEELTRVLEIGRSTLKGMEGVLDDPPPRAIVTEVGDSWVVVRFFGWVDQRKVSFDTARSEAVRLTKEALDTAGIAMPAPEYGLRLLDLGPGGKIEVEAIPPGEALAGTPEVEEATEPERTWGAERVTEAAGVAEAAPPPDAADLGPDRALEEQIARDREETQDRDLLGPAG
jgi:hypothetical protein